MKFVIGVVVTASVYVKCPVHVILRVRCMCVDGVSVIEVISDSELFTVTK